jgi:NAD(P)-dependent dehydrogenase (short-subunit alcohol dehydrogenase family)
MVASLDVNVPGVVFSISAFLSLLGKGAVKKIIVLSTGIADPEAIVVSGNSGSVTYSAMKAALNVIVAKYSQELGGGGFTVLALSPGLVNTREDTYVLHLHLKTHSTDSLPATPEELEQLKGMIQQSKTYAADWNVPISPAESVDAMKKVIDEKGLQDTGAFLSHWGNNN